MREKTRGREGVAYRKEEESLRARKDRKEEGRC